MQTVSIKYDLKWRFKKFPQYAVTSCRKVVNTRRNRFLKQSLNGGSIGYWIVGNFFPKSKINDMVELIKEETLPF